MPNIIAETAVESFIDNFQRQSWVGQPWQPLSPKYLRKVTRSSGRILTRTGNLQRSIRPAVVSAGLVRISAGSAKVPYARAHNEGVQGVQSVRSFSRKSGQSVKAHTRKMNLPRRQYMGINPATNTLIRDRMVRFLKS